MGSRHGVLRPVRSQEAWEYHEPVPRAGSPTKPTLIQVFVRTGWTGSRNKWRLVTRMNGEYNMLEN